MKASVVAAPGQAPPTKHLTTVASPRKVIQGTPLHLAQLKSNYDAIVIGSGIGGLSAAVALSKFAGQKVLVLEQHYTAGGLTQAFQRDNKYAWNVGVHYIGGGIGKRGGDIYPAFNALTNGRVSWAKLPEAYDRIIIGDRAYDFVEGEEAWLDKMTGYFPAERKALEQILKMADETWDAYRLNLTAKAMPEWVSGLTNEWTIKPWSRLAGQTTAEMLAGLTKDSELRAVLAGEYADIGAPPGYCSAAYHLVLLKHYLQGAYVPVGGANEIAAAMIPIIEEAGGAVVTCADVSEVLVTPEDNKVTGVKLANGEEISSSTVISSAGVLNTYGGLLPSITLNQNPAIQQQLNQAKALSNRHHFSEFCALYCALEEQPVPEFKDIGCIHKHHSVDLQGDADRLRRDPSNPFDYVFFSCCDGREKVTYEGVNGVVEASSGDGNPLSTLQVVIPAPYEWFKRWDGSKWHQRGQDYKDFKEEIKQRLLAELGSVFPDLPNRIKFTELSTPLSTEYFTRWGRGGSYGLPMVPERFQANKGQGFGPHTPLKGLYLTGQDVSGDGVVPAMMSGVFSAVAARGVGVMLGYGKECRKWT